MKVVVVDNMVPFRRGRTDELACSLVKQLVVRGHPAELVRIPVKCEPPEQLLSEMLLCKLLQLYGVDRVIALSFPSYLVPHHDKVLWLSHHVRRACGPSATLHSNIGSTERDRALRAAILQSDNECFAKCKSIFVHSEQAQVRLEQSNHCTSEILHPPVDDPELFFSESYQDYVFCGGGIGDTARHSLLVEAMRYVRSPGKLLIAGPAEGGEDELRIRRLIDQHRLQDRVILEIGMHSREAIASWLRNSLATACIPVAEDSYHACAMEAVEASKAVLTTSDSGGVARLVQHGSTGWVSEPSAAGLADHLETIFSSPGRSRQMGAAARDDWVSRNINWDITIQKLAS